MIQDFKRDVLEKVYHPPHYANLSPEPIDVIEAWKLDFHLGQVVKYIAWAGNKQGEGELDDLQKAQWYLARKIARIKNERNK